MASITSLTGSSSTSSIYGTRNIISGMASGLDTETLISNSVQGYHKKIAQLQQKYTKTEWRQEAYRSIISKLSNFTTKYTSYTSNTNLMSASFFNSSVTVSTQGKYADKVSAAGKSSSDIQLLGVKQLARTASYTVSGVGGSNSENPAIQGGEIDLSGIQELSNVSGSLTIKYGGERSFTLDFGELDIYHSADELAKAIEEKLGEQTMTLSDGTSVKVSSKIDVSVNGDGNIVFTDTSGAGNGVTISSATGKIKETLKIDSSSEESKKGILTTKDADLVNEEGTVGDYLSGKELSFTVDGVTKKITLGEFSGETTGEEFLEDLQSKLDKAFGTGKVDLSGSSADGAKFTLKAAVAKGSTMSISGSAAKAVGLASENETTYVNTGKKLSEILGNSFDWTDTCTMLAAEGDKSEFTLVKATSTTDAYYKDAAGNRVAKDEAGNWYQVDEKGKFLHKFEINGEVVGKFSEETALESVMTSLNSNTESGVTVSYSKITNQFKFEARESGATGKIDFGQDGLAAKLFGGTEDTVTYQEGQDAIFSVSVNGTELTDITRSSNSFNLDGLTLNLKGTFGYEADNRVEVSDGIYKADTFENNPYGTKTLKIGSSTHVLDFKFMNENGEYVTEDGMTYQSILDKYSAMGITLTGIPTTGEFFYQDAEGNKITDAAQQTTGKLIKGTEAVTFETKADADKIVDAIKSMVEDYNAMVTEIKKAYSTLPETNSKGNAYEPLTDEDKEGMTESAIKNYEEKAKTGLLFGDQDLSSLYNRLREAISMTGKDGADLADIGITTAYSDGLTTLSLDENKLRSALEADPDKVRDIFTKSTDNGASTNGLMQALKAPLEMYGKTTGTKGILVEKAGSTLAPTSLYQNTIQTELDKITDEIEKWQDKLSDKIDYYTNKFTQLEVLINEMNSQSSALMGLTGGY